MILVTGGNGYIGRHLIPDLRRRGEDVVAWTRAEHDLTQPIRSDLQPNTVIHLAGRIEISLRPNPHRPDGPPISGPQDTKMLYEANAHGTANLARWCIERGVHHLIYASSQSVYGWPTKDIWHEDSELAPLEDYAASKACAELALHTIARAGIRVTILRLPGLFGGDRKAGAVYSMLQTANRHLHIVVNAGYAVPLDVLYIEDAVQALAAAAFRWPEYDAAAQVRVYNIATGEACSLELLALDAISLIPGTRLTLDQYRHHPVRVDVSRASRELNWRSRPRIERMRQVLNEIRQAEYAEDSQEET